jgi:hypothetical protein
MRALDKFGNTVQLKHAREAALRHGRLVVVACSREMEDEGMGVVVVSVGNRPILSSLTLPLASIDHQQQQQQPSSSSSSSQAGAVAMCCTGIKSDADWLTKHMQEYVAKVWERYNLHPMSTSALAHWLARLLTSYQLDDNDLDDEWQSSISRTRRRGQEDELESSLSRPLGVQTILLSTSGLVHKRASNNPALLLIEPTGRVFRADTTTSFSFLTMGKQSDKLKEALLRCTRKGDESLEDVLTREIMTLLAQSKNEIIEVLVEYLGTTKMQSILLRYQSGKLLSRAILELKSD